jgi:hypothetical protein
VLMTICIIAVDLEKQRRILHTKTMVRLASIYSDFPECHRQISTLVQYMGPVCN